MYWGILVTVYALAFLCLSGSIFAAVSMATASVCTTKSLGVHQRGYNT
jgi:hypothetical protein